MNRTTASMETLLFTQKGRSHIDFRLVHFWWRFGPICISVSIPFSGMLAVDKHVALDRVTWYYRWHIEQIWIHYIIYYFFWILSHFIGYWIFNVLLWIEMVWLNYYFSCCTLYTYGWYLNTLQELCINGSILTPKRI